MLSISATMKFLNLIVPLLFLLPAKLQAQEIGMEGTLQFLNEKLKGRYQLWVDRRELNVFVFDEEGEKVRKDVMPLDDMNANVQYYHEEGSIVLRCRIRGDHCVERRQLIKKKKDYIHRFNFSVNEDEAESIREALEHIVLLVQNPNQKRTEPFE